MGKSWLPLITSLLMVTTVLCGDDIKGEDTDNDGMLTPDRFPYHENLDTNYQLRWKFNSTHIIFQTEVKTTGYVGFGISNHGSMYPSDVIIAWVKDGQVYFDDRHATGHYLPPVDAHQDWHLISGSEVNKVTTITFIRALTTCDSEDLPITSDTTKVIYSYGASDPTTKNDIAYHGSSRGTKSIMLLYPPPKQHTGNTLTLTTPANVTTVDFLNQNYSVPAADTTYSCTILKLPPLKEKHHLVRYDPVIQKGHEKLVHHILIYLCTGPIDEEFVGTHYECYGPNSNRHLQRSCSSSLITAWAIGGTTFEYPPHVGFPLGNANDTVYFKMETHYDNVYMRNDFVDNSGIRIHLTKQLRQFDAGMLIVGTDVNKFQIIPPYDDKFVSTGYCHEDCIAEAIGDDEIYIFSDFLHAHLIAKSIHTRHVRNGTELPPILEDSHYDFNYQEARVLKEERVVKKGDSLFTDCYYDSTKRRSVTYGGFSSRHEMCQSFLLYYPKKPLSFCMSSPAYNVLSTVRQHSVFDVISYMDWTKKEAHDKFAKMMENPYTWKLCRLGDKYESGVTTKPVITQPFVPEDQCKQTRE